MNGGAKAKFILLNKKSLNKNKKLYTDLLGIFVANSLHYGYAFTEDVLLSFLPDKEDKLLLYVENNFMVNGLGIISHKYIDNNNGGMHIYNLLFSFAFDLQIYKNLLDYFIKNIKHKEEYRLFINIINYDKKEELKIIKKLGYVPIASSKTQVHTDKGTIKVDNIVFADNKLVKQLK